MLSQRLREVLVTPHTNWTEEQSYRWVVLPLGAMLISAGIALVIVFGFLDVPPNGPLPFVESPAVNRWGFAAIGSFVLTVGVGLIRRSVIAWHAFFAYFALGTLGIILGSVFDPRPSSPPGAILPFVVAFNGMFVWVVYVTTRRVFLRASAAPTHSP